MVKRGNSSVIRVNDFIGGAVKGDDKDHAVTMEEWILNAPTEKKLKQFPALA